jgi:hypothetical protein
MYTHIAEQAKGEKERGEGSHLADLLCWADGHLVRGAHRVPTPTPLPPREGRQVQILFNKEITPLLPTGIGERFSQTISNLGHAALLRQSELPPINESTELTQGQGAF